MMPKPRSLHIERLELDLAGVDPQLARAMLDRLGPALAAALGARPVAGRSVERIDAGRIAAPSPADAGALADSIATRVAHALGGSAGDAGTGGKPS